MRRADATATAVVRSRQWVVVEKGWYWVRREQASEDPAGVNPGLGDMGLSPRGVARRRRPTAPPRSDVRSVRLQAPHRTTPAPLARLQARRRWRLRAMSPNVTDALEWSVRAIAEELGVLPEFPPSHLYHYTSATGVRAILRDRQVWASEATALNDWSEFRAGLQHMVEACELFAADSDRPDLVSALGIAMGVKLPRNPAPFITSFSESGDSLGQWRAYGEYAIGLSWQQVRHIAFEHHGVLMPCIYDLDHQRLICARLVAEAIHQIRLSQESDNPPRTDQQATLDWVNANVEEICVVASMCKPDGFAEEREWRVIVPPSSRQIKPDYREDRAGNLIRYASLSIERALAVKHDQLKSPQIVVGPSMQQNDLSLTATLMLRDFGFENGTARQSVIPYRTGR